MLNSSDHTHRYRHFTCTINYTGAQLAEIYVLVKLHITGLAPATLCQLAWRTGYRSSPPKKNSAADLKFSNLLYPLPTTFTA